MKNKFLALIFIPIREFMFELSFLTILNMYKDCFRAVTADAHQCKSSSQAYYELETYAIVHLSIQEADVFVHHRVFLPRSFVIFIV